MFWYNAFCLVLWVAIAAGVDSTHWDRSACLMVGMLLGTLWVVGLVLMFGVGCNVP